MNHSPTTPVAARPVRDFLSAGFPRPAHVPTIDPAAEGAPPLAELRKPAASPALAGLFVTLARDGYPCAPETRAHYEAWVYWEGRRRESTTIGSYDQAVHALHQLRVKADARRAKADAARRAA